MCTYIIYSTLLLTTKLGGSTLNFSYHISKLQERMDSRKENNLDKITPRVFLIFINVKLENDTAHPNQR
jgi:hypothetical protein